MATWATRPIAPVKRLDGYTFVTYPLAAAQDFERGALVLRNADGNIAECGADPASIAGVALAAVADYAWQDDTFGKVSPRVPVATADQEFRGTLLGTFAAADVGASYGVVDSAGTWVVDKADAVNTRVQIVGVDDEVAVGDVNPPVRFVFLVANRQVIS